MENQPREKAAEAPKQQLKAQGGRSASQPAAEPQVDPQQGHSGEGRMGSDAAAPQATTSEQPAEPEPPQQVEAALLTKIKQGYARDPLYGPDAAADRVPYKLRQRDDLWLRGTAVCVPKTDGLRTACIAAVHDPPYSGHLGTSKTLATLARLFWWPAHDELQSVVPAKLSMGACRQLPAALAAATADACHFLASAIAGQQMLLCPPRADASSYIRHYLYEKKARPYDTSACIVGPERFAKQTPLSAGMQLVKQYGRGDSLFEGGASLQEPCQAFWDPALPTGTALPVVAAGTTQTDTEEEPLVLQQPTMMFMGTVAGFPAVCGIDIQYGEHVSCQSRLGQTGRSGGEAHTK